MARNIVIVGQQKTGTTGVYSLIKDTVGPLSGEYYFLFEPSNGQPIIEIQERAPELSILTKIMFKNAASFPFERFDRFVMTIRDPRDTIISTLLFKPMLKNIATAVPMENHQRFIDGLKAKEADPSSGSVSELMALADDVGYRKHRPDRFAKELEAMQQVIDEHGMFIVRYEDFVDGKVEGLGTYLSLPLDPGLTSTPSWLQHISRSKSHGAWRHWFTTEDVDLYRPLLAPYLEAMGYDDDWQLAEAPVIDPRESSQYVASSLEKRRRELSVLAKGGDRSSRDRDLSTLYSMAADGDVKASVALARELRSGRQLGSPWMVSARYWAHRAALQGSDAAAILLADLDAATSPEPPSPDSAIAVRPQSSGRIGARGRRVQKMARSALRAGIERIKR